ncbi:MAG TPA: ATP-binding protein [Thermoplasmata archaeon]|nr:ATP-binding protein [Thermoplasmata archaeon]
MPVDLSGALISAFEKAKGEYEKARAEGNFKLAKEKAEECARIMKALAKNVPDYADTYLKRAEKWKKLAENVGIGHKKIYETTEEKAEDEFKEYIQTLISKSKVKWSEIGGLEEVKQLMMETIVIAGLKKPEAIKPWKGILLFGPPGTGKTLLATASAGGLNATFFNVKADKILSKYFGESSKLVSALYEVAREKAPSIIFIDEFDALSLSRAKEASEASRRMLSTLLAELDGFQDKENDDFVLTLAATNTPWDLDQAMLSRFPRRIYVPLPDKKACGEIIKIHTKGLDISMLNLSELSKRCVEKLFSGRDIANLCQQAIWNMIREENKNLEKMANLSYNELKKKELKTRPIHMKDFEVAFNKVRPPLSKEDIERYIKWNEKYGG